MSAPEPRPSETRVARTHASTYRRQETRRWRRRARTAFATGTTAPGHSGRRALIPHGGEIQPVANLDLAGIEVAGWKLDDGPGAQRHRDPPRRHARRNANGTTIAIDEHEVDR